MTNVNLDPGEAGTLDDLIAGTGDGAAHRDQPLVVDRQSPAALPVRGRGGLGDPRRSAAGAGSQPQLRRQDARLLGQLRRRLLALGLAPHVAAQLRQGRAGPGDARVARLGARPLSRTCRSALPDALDLASRAVAHAGGDALALVTRERSLLLRFAANRPTQSTAVDDVTVELALVFNGHVGRATTNSADEASLADCARRAAAGGRRRRRGGRRLLSRAFPSRPPAGAHEGHDPATAALDPDGGGAALRTAFGVAADAGVEAHGIWTAGEERARRGHQRRWRGGRPDHRRVHEGDLHPAPERAERLRRPDDGGGRGPGRPGAGGAGRRQGDCRRRARRASAGRAPGGLRGPRGG